MVESTKNSKDTIETIINTISQLCLSKITEKDIEFDICQMEKFTEGCPSFEEEEKKLFLEKNLEMTIRKSLFEEDIKIRNLSYQQFKELLFERYGKPPISITEYFAQKQSKFESIASFVRRMEKDGMRLKLTGNVRLQVIKLGIMNHQKAMLQILNGKKKITEEIIDSLKDQEALEIRFAPRPMYLHSDNIKIPNPVVKNYMCFSYGKPGHIVRNCRAGKSNNTMNNIEKELNSINKDSFIYILSSKIKPIFDTGAVDNYITKRLVERLGLKADRKKYMEKKYTCLDQTFYVKEELRIEFIYKGKKWRELFNILPGRSDETIDNLKTKLFIRNPKGITLEYECPINCKEEDRITEGTPIIPQTIESKVEDTVKELLNLGYISISNSS